MANLGTLTLYLPFAKLKKLITLALTSSLLAGCSPLSLSGSDNYEIQWTGASGSELFASYGIASKNPGTPSTIEKVTAKLPYKISFTAPKNTLISASGMLMNQGTVEIKIFRNGSECGKAAFVGSGAMANKICS